MEERLRIHKTEDGKCICPVCQKTFMRNSIFGHIKQKHEGIKATTVDRSTIAKELYKEKRRLDVKMNVTRYRERKKGRPRRHASKKVNRPLYCEEDVERYGVFGCRNPIVIYKKSNIPNAGNGIFANENLYEGDYITYYEGEIVTEKPENDFYTIQLNEGDHKGKYLKGIQTPQKKRGLGSFINCEDKSVSRARKNCHFVEHINDRKVVYIVACRDISKGEELYTSYGRGYWNKKGEKSIKFILPKPPMFYFV